jgi:hypothetical protein
MGHCDPKPVPDGTGGSTVDVLTHPKLIQWRLSMHPERVVKSQYF